MTESKQSSSGAGGGLHWVGRVTDEVFSFLGPASATLAQSGVEQTIVMFDEPGYRYLLPRFHKGVRLVLTPADPSPYRRWRQAHRAFADAIRNYSPMTVHLHGFVPYVLSVAELGKLPEGRAVYYSPHGSRALRIRAMPSRLLWAALAAARANAKLREVANIGTELRALETLSHQPVVLVESQVSDAFFSMPRREARHPLIVTGNRAPAPKSADLFSRFAVLLGDEHLNISFNWIGGSDAASEARLRAANVGVLDEIDDTLRAKRLAACWVFVATHGTDGFPLFLAEAMAAGVPCVAVDTPYHRDLIVHGSTGYLCRTEEELLECAALLLDSPTLRTRVGMAGRAQAEHRFSARTFRDSMFHAYDLESSGPAAEACVPRSPANRGLLSPIETALLQATSVPTRSRV